MAGQQRGCQIEPAAHQRLSQDSGRAAPRHWQPLTGIPPEAWDYRLGNRSAIDWALDQHKEKRPRDPTVAARFNTYRFADHKESMIKLLAKVVRVSVETMKIVTEMREKSRIGAQPSA